MEDVKKSDIYGSVSSVLKVQLLIALSQLYSIWYIRWLFGKKETTYFILLCLFIA